ncbi:uncharacterized protein BCR38DRAFT_456364 [Pseudomassariella vexata]|uniref:EGF-like domain-containing protein n=1 Tax=Pseudomassariella vexata TaxID=1141098 RepID=A0A1Y2E807_9PEZI|nr:uncharacterized protein BCR38DRAFT_456364 [Pseudomassariella vexata]ORY67672.1 hypothetical protein BCR38DRAFT_456364 [Pseudomassariella vexata]
MSRPQNGNEMDQTYGSGGSVRRARERAEAGLPREMFAGIPPSSIPRRVVGNPGSRPQAPEGLQTRDENGNIGMAISRPQPAPQWPLPGPISSPPSSDGSEPYRPPLGKSQPPQRPPRPSQVPSMLDASRMQDHTPVFQYAPQNQRMSEMSVPETPATSGSSRLSVASSVGSIPDFPLPTTPGQTPGPTPGPTPPPVPLLPPPRRSVILGPPPSSRRGASSFYSTISYVSPIPEESPRSRSHASYASSAAIPESFGTISPGISSDGNYFDDAIAEESVYSDDADESRLVRSASVGRKGKPSLVTTRSSEPRGDRESVPIVLQPIPQPIPRPMQVETLQDGMSYLDMSSSSSATPSSSNRPPVKAPVTADTMLGAFEAASATDPTSMRNTTSSPKHFSRLSALRRPPRLNMDAVREAEARGSLTSLPDLIRRATRLASLMERGKRPASRFDELDFPEDIYNRDLEKDPSYELDKHQSGLSDMLAAFPPPAQANSRRSVRQSRASWPLAFPLGRMSVRGAPNVPEQTTTDVTSSPQPRQPPKGRRCCGLPMWGFILLMIVLLLVMAAAVVIPVEFFVVRKQQVQNTTTSALATCQAQVKCDNGGTNVITDGVCSCICSNGFTGANCTISSSQGCTTTSFGSGDNNLNNVTLGEAIPRLIQEAQTNFSIALSATRILSKFNAANLSCNSENALVTFNGQSSRDQDASAVADSSLSENFLQIVQAEEVITISVLSDLNVILTLDPAATNSVYITTLSMGAPASMVTVGTSVVQTTITMTITATPTSTPAPTTTTTPIVTASASTTSAAGSTSTFAATEQALDFARVAVLFVLQEESLEGASNAQITLQKLFSTAGSINDARNVTIGGDNTIDLVNFLVDLGSDD